MFLQEEYVSEVDFVRYESMLKGVAYTMAKLEYCDCYVRFDEDDECFKLDCMFYDKDNNDINWCIGIEISTLKYEGYRRIIEDILYRVNQTRIRLIGE